eukprot:symbB.v1.2.017530.t2/scaffold1371.1/size209032/2
MDTVPILRQISKHASDGVALAVLEQNKAEKPIQLSYAELKRCISSLSTAIKAMLEVKSDLPRHASFFIQPSLSIWAAGGVCVPLSVHSPVPELEYFVKDSESCLCLADSAGSSKMKTVAEKLVRQFATVMKAPTGYELVREGSTNGHSVAKTEPSCFSCFCGLLGPTDVTSNNALILYTSGTTGQPKGVVHTFKSLTSQMVSLSSAWKWSSKDRTLHVLPLHHIHGNILNSALFNGAAVEVTVFDAEFCLKRLTSGDITCFHAVPTIYVKFTQFLDTLSTSARAEFCQGLRNPSLRYMVSGSAALPVPTMKSWAEISGHVLLERYGMTEIGMALSNRIDGTRFPGCVGWPLPDVEVKQDEVGLFSRSITSARRLQRRSSPAMAFSSRSLVTEKPHFTVESLLGFRTGDNAQKGGSAEELQKLQDDARDVETATRRPRPDTLAKADPELGAIYRIMGRTSVDIIKSGGYKISGLEIESVLLQHEKIRECAVVGKPDETWGEKVTAVCVLQNGAVLTIKELRDWGKERMASYKVPQDLEIVTELPRNQMGKLEKKKILERYKK